MSLPTTTKKFSVQIQDPKWVKLINDTLGDKETSKRFIAAISSAVAINPTLQLCEPGSVLTGALVGESYKFAHSPQLGHYYLVPFDITVKGKDESGKEVSQVVKKAQFLIGFKGYVQLAMRSGQYRKLNVIDIKEGELQRIDILNEEIVAVFIDDPVRREQAKTIGYYAMFELVNGYRKAIYWSKEKMEAHALKYSQGYKVKKGYTYWEKDFDGMAFKTMLRQIISKWGPMSIEMQDAYTKDMAVLNDDGSPQYIDNDTDLPPVIIEQGEPIINDDPSTSKKVNLNDV